MNGRADILSRILGHKALEVAERKSTVPLGELWAALPDTAPPRGFLAAIERRIAGGGAAVIAEIKKASPSQDVIREHFVPAEIARDYAAHGATCLSVLTDREFFQGDDTHLGEARESSGLPTLRKDFIVDPYQVVEARRIGADCVLLIVAALSDQQLAEFSGLATDLGMDVLVEVHDAGELYRALDLNVPLIGINNRDLRSFETRLDTTLDLLEELPEHCTVVTESGINTARDVALMRRHGVNAFLVGEAFMRVPSPGDKLAELFATHGRDD